MEETENIEVDHRSLTLEEEETRKNFEVDCNDCCWKEEMENNIRRNSLVVHKVMEDEMVVTRMTFEEAMIRRNLMGERWRSNRQSYYSDLYIIIYTYFNQMYTKNLYKFPKASITITITSIQNDWRSR